MQSSYDEDDIHNVTNDDDDEFLDALGEDSTETQE